MLRKLIVAAAASVLSFSAFAVDTVKVEKSIPLKDGSTLYIYKDGKMAMESKTGRPERMKEGHIMETKDGQKIMMKGDEVWRLEPLNN